MGNYQAYSQDVASIKKRFSFIFLSFIGAVVFCFFNVQNVKALDRPQGTEYDKTFFASSTHPLISGYSYRFPFIETVDDPDYSDDIVTSITIGLESLNFNCSYKLTALDRNLNSYHSDCVTPTTGQVFQTFSFHSPNLRINDLFSVTPTLQNGSCTGACFQSDQYQGLFYGGNTATSTTGVYLYYLPDLGISSSFLTPYFLINSGRTQIQFSTTPTSTCDFDAWKVHNYISDADLSSSVDWSAGVVMTDSATGDYIFNDNYGGLGSLSYDYGIRKSLKLAENKTYYAKAYLCSEKTPEECELDGPNIIDSTEEYSFTILSDSSCSSTYQFQGEGDYTTSSLYTSISFSCDNVSGTIEKGLCNVFKFLFAPSDSSFLRFSNLKTSLEDKPPFGYFTAIESVFEAFDDDYSTSTTSTVMFSSFYVFSELEIVKTFRFLLGLILWVLFGWWLFYRIRKFDFKG